LQNQSSFIDLVVIDPEDFGKATVDALEDQINAKYANKVLSLSLSLPTPRPRR
jgi:DNA-directed RNA polymerase subunit E'/Rpb7